MIRWKRVIVIGHKSLDWQKENCHKNTVANDVRMRRNLELRMGNSISYNQNKFGIAELETVKLF